MAIMYDIICVGDNMKSYDIVIIGGGPAGLTAGIYALRSGCSVCVVERAMIGGQVALSSEVANYTGVPKLVGVEWSAQAQQQVKDLGGAFVYDQVTAVNANKNYVQLANDKIGYKALIIATGAKPRKLQVQGEEQLLGKGVSYCAICDGGLYRGKDVIVVGGGDSAYEDALYLSNICKSVQVLVRSVRVRAQQILVDDVNKCANVQVLKNAHLVVINGKDAVQSAVINVNGVNKEVNVQGVFVAIGRVPDTEYLTNVVNLDDHGYITTDENMCTSKCNIYAAGDVRHKEIRQIITACSDGAIAATNASKYVKNTKEK